MKVLITGSTGFIGGSLATRLIELGWDIRLLVRNPHRSLPDRFRACRLFFNDFSKDDSSSLQKAIEGCDVVFHSAAIRNRWGTLPQDYRKVNVEGTRSLLQASLGRAKRFVYVSSVGVFGYPGALGIDETFPTISTAGLGDYHASKVAAEQIVNQYAQAIETVIVRPTITYGPGDETGMVTRLIELILNHKFVMIGNGRNHIHLTYIDDLLQGLYQAMTHPAAAGQTFILAGPKPTQVYQLVRMIEDYLRTQITRLYIPEPVANLLGTGLTDVYRMAYVVKIIDRKIAPPLTRQMVSTLCKNRGFSNTKAKELIDFRPNYHLEKGLSLTIKWLAATKRLRLKKSVDQ